MTPNQMRAKAKKLEQQGGNQDQINKLLDDANDAEEKKYQESGGGYKKGGKVSMKAVAAKAVKAHEKRMHGKKMSGGGSVRGDGCATRGKTRGRIV